MESGRPKKTLTEFKVEKNKFMAEIKEDLVQSRIREAKNMDIDELREEIKNIYNEIGMGKLAKYITALFLQRDQNIITDFRTDNIQVYDNDREYFKNIGSEMIKALLTELIKTHNTRNTSEEVLHLIRTQTYKYDEERFKAAPLNLIPLANGVYDLNTDELLPNDPKYLFDIQIPVNYNQKNECPAIEKFIGEIIDEEEKLIIYDIFGLLLYRKNFLEKFFIFNGEGQNGKSKLIELMQKFIGEENSSSITLKQLTDDRFAVARTCKKLLNVGADISGAPITDTSILKSASASDKISGQFKFGQIFDFTPSATEVFSANKPPIFYDDSVGMFRRAELITFRHLFGNVKDMEENLKCKKADPQILDKLTTSEELSGLLNIALKHLKLILSTGQLSIVKSAKELRTNYIKASNSVQAFCETCCEEAEYIPADKEKGNSENIPAQGFLTVFDLYKAYSLYCKDQNINIKTKDGFSKIMRKLSEWNLEFSQQDSKTGIVADKTRSVRGIKFKVGCEYAI